MASNTGFSYKDSSGMDHEYTVNEREVVVLFRPSNASILQAIEGELEEKNKHKVMNSVSKGVRPAVEYNYTENFPALPQNLKFGFALFEIDANKKTEAIQYLDTLRNDGKIDYMPAFEDKLPKPKDMKYNPHKGITYFLPGHAAIRFSDPDDNEVIQKFLTNNGLSRVKKCDALGLHIVRLPVDNSISAANALFGKIENFSGISPIESLDGVRISFHIQASGRWPTDPNVDPQDPNYADQWGFETTGQSYSARIDGAWALETGDPNTIIAFVDTGLDTGHQDLGLTGSRLFDKFNTKDNNTDVTDNDGHGTNVASIAVALADNTVGIAGIAPACNVIAYKAGEHLAAVVNADFAEAIQRLANSAASNTSKKYVLNLSWRIQSYDPDINTSIKAAGGAYASNVVVVCAAGDDDWNIETNSVWPAVYAYDSVQHVIAVAAHKAGGGRKELSNYSSSGANSGKVISAPGDNIRTYDPNNTTPVTRAGSSFAASFVSGVAALMRSKNPARTKSDIISLIMSNTFGTPGFVKGRLHGKNSVSAV